MMWAGIVVWVVLTLLTGVGCARWSRRMNIQDEEVEMQLPYIVAAGVRPYPE